MPNLGRWTSEDPALKLWDVDRLMHHQAYAWSPYAYVKNDPIGRFDPDGFTDWPAAARAAVKTVFGGSAVVTGYGMMVGGVLAAPTTGGKSDRKSTRLNSSHVAISYAVF